MPAAVRACWNVSASAFFLLCWPALSLALPVFPGAVGYGTDTPAGRAAAASDIYEVTTLADDYQNPTAGMLRYGVERIARPRVIIFRVSGVIELRKDLNIRALDGVGDHGYLTIAGQTAPFPGITLKNGGIRINSHDVLIQHIAVRPGNDMTTGPGWDLTTLDNRDCIRVESGTAYVVSKIVVDHISCSWTTDESASVWGSGANVEEVTFSNSIFADPIQFGGHTDGSGNLIQHGYGPLVGVNSYDVSLIGNVMAFNWSRNPLIRDRVADAQVINNFIYRPGPQRLAAMEVGTARADSPNWPLDVSAIGNVVLRHPATTWHGTAYTVNTIGFYIETGATTALGLFLNNNSVYSPTTGVWYPTDGNPYSTAIYDQRTTPAAFYGADPHADSGGTSWTPLSEAPAVIEGRIVPNAGKFSGYPDVIDADLTGRISSRTGTWLEYFTDLGTNPWAPVDVQNVATYTLPENPTGDSDADGYTNLEEWLHGLAAAVEGRITAPLDPLMASFNTFTDNNSIGLDTSVPNADGAWAVSSGTLQQSNTAGSGRAVVSQSNWTDQVVQTVVQPTTWGGAGFVSVFARFNGLNDTYYMTLRSTKVIELKRINTTSSGSTAITVYGTVNLPSTFDLTAPHTLRLEVVGFTLKGYLDGVLQFTGTDAESRFASGRAAVGTYLVAAKFDNVFASPFTQSVPQITDDFEDGNSTGWTTTGTGIAGSWAIQTDPASSANTVFSQTLTTDNGRATWSTSPTNQSTQARVKVTAFGGSGFIAVYARSTAFDSAYYITLRSTKILELKKIVPGTVTTLATVTLPSSFDLTQWHTLRLEATGSSITTLRAYLDGELKVTKSDSSSPFTSGKGAVGTYLAAAQFDDIVLTAP